MNYPIFDFRTCIGYAKTQKQADRIVRGIISIPAGFTLNVRMRPQYVSDILQLPQGFVYDLYK
jgi:hypothetical protein